MCTPDIECAHVDYQGPADAALAKLQVQRLQESCCHCLCTGATKVADRIKGMKMERGEEKKGGPFFMFIRDFVKDDTGISQHQKVLVLLAG